MKYTIHNIINKPHDVVIEYFKNTEGAKEWMEGLYNIEPLSGQPGEVGAKTNFYFKHKKRDMKIEETILEQNFPNQIKFAYQSPMGYSEVEMIFEKLDDHHVKQINNSYFQLKGIMKLLGPLMKGMFKKQSMTYLNGFKQYVENQ